MQTFGAGLKVSLQTFKAGLQVKETCRATLEHVLLEKNMFFVSKHVFLISKNVFFSKNRFHVCYCLKNV